MIALAVIVVTVTLLIAVYAVFRRGSRWPDGHCHDAYWQRQERPRV